jgi:hypothetical protein
MRKLTCALVRDTKDISQNRNPIRFDLTKCSTRDIQELRFQDHSLAADLE